MNEPKIFRQNFNGNLFAIESFGLMIISSSQLLQGHLKKKEDKNKKTKKKSNGKFFNLFQEKAVKVFINKSIAKSKN